MKEEEDDEDDEEENGFCDQTMKFPKAPKKEVKQN